MNAPLADELEAAASRVIRSGQYVLGEEVAAFEREFADYIGVRHSVGVNSGLDALTLSLLSLQLPKGSEMILPAHTFAATALSVIHAGLTPVLAEPNLGSFNLDPKEVEKKITSKTKAVIAVHLYGRPADLSSLSEICDRHGLYLLEDAAQAHGASYQGRKVGAFGKLAAFSFYPAKNLGALGDAGAILTDDDALAERLRQLRNYGSERKYNYSVTGHNSRMDELQAAVLRVKLRHLDAHNARKRQLAKAYCDRLDTRFIRPEFDENSVYHVFPVLHNDRDSLRERLAAKGIGTGVHYPQPFHGQPAFEPHFAGQHFPITDSICARELSLPISVALSDMDQERVIRVLNAMT